MRQILSSVALAALMTLVVVPSPAAVATGARATLERAQYMVIGLRGSAQAMDNPLGMSGVTGAYALEALQKTRRRTRISPGPWRRGCSSGTSTRRPIPAAAREC